MNHANKGGNKLEKINRRDFLQIAGTVALLEAVSALTGCSGSAPNGQISSSTGENGEKLIIDEIKTSIGKDTHVNNGYSYKIEDVFKNETSEGYTEYGYRVWVTAPSEGGVIYTDNFKLYIDGQNADSVSVDPSKSFGSAPGSLILPRGSQQKITVKGKAPTGGNLLKVEIIASDISFITSGVNGTTKKQTIISCEVQI